MADKRKPRTPPAHYVPASGSADVSPVAKPVSERAPTTSVLPTSTAVAAVKPRRVATLDDRDLTKKAKATLQVWEGAQRGQMVAGMLQRQINDLKEAVGGGKGAVLMGKDTGALVIGIPCPSLAFEFLIAQDCFPLGLVIQLVALAGTGKCLGLGTPVLLATGEVIPVEQIKCGAQLLGPAGDVRTVIQVTQGVSPLYRIDPVRGESWVCNEEHILTLVHSGSNSVIDISVKDWLTSPPQFRRYYKLYSVGVAQFSATKALPIDPYFLGVWFGDGTKTTKALADGSVVLAKVAVSKPDAEIRAACEATAATWGLTVTPDDDTYSLVGIRGAANHLLDELRGLVGPGVTVPPRYLRASRADRLQFLAGFLDTDAELSCNCFIISQKREDWARAVWWLARSLGFCATFSSRQASCPRSDGTVFTGNYYVVTISGDVDQIPTRLPRRQAKPRKQVKKATRTGFTVTPIGRGPYYGFTLDGDGRFLLGDFTVTHNSALLAEFYRWFDLAGGGGVFMENESKFNPQWYQSIMREAYDRLQYHKCQSVEDWQRHLTHSIRFLKRDMEGTKKDPGPGKTIPVLFGVDSLMGRQSEATQEQILGVLTEAGLRGTTGDGHASRGFPIEALIITRYLRTIPQELDFWPFTLVLVNHLKIEKGENNTVERIKGGGKIIDFQESFELELTKLGGAKKKISCAYWEGYPVKLSCHKNSFGPGHREIHTRLIWWYEPDEAGGFIQRTVWDWDWSTVWLLNNILRGDKPDPQLKANLKEIGFHLECPTFGEVENTAWSKDLGMTEKDEPRTWSEIGALIREDKDLLDRIRVALRINRRPLLAGDYLAQKDALAKEQP